MNRRWERNGSANTPFATYLGVDFEVEKVDFDLDPAWKKKLNAQGLSKEAANELAGEAVKTHNNVVQQITIVLRVVKV